MDTIPQINVVPLKKWYQKINWVKTLVFAGALIFIIPAIYFFIGLQKKVSMLEANQTYSIQAYNWISICIADGYCPNVPTLQQRYVQINATSTK